MSQTTYLEYTCVSSPLIANKTQDIIIIATLKTTEETGVPITSVNVSEIVLDFGNLGKGAENLTENKFTQADIKGPKDWTSHVSGASCTLSPGKDGGLVETNALVIVISNVSINPTLGNITLTVKESATAYSPTGETLPITTSGNPGIESIVLPKVDQAEAQISFNSNPVYISAGDSTTLSWSGGSEDATYTLHYINDGNLIQISDHANGHSFNANDVYPDRDLVPKDPPIILNFTATFILKINEKDNITKYVSTSAIVSQPDIYANSLTMPYPSGQNENSLIIGDPTGLDGYYAALSIIYKKDAEAYPFAVIDDEGQLTCHIQSNGDIKISGTLSASDAVLTGNVIASNMNTDDITVNGPINADIVNSDNGGEINGFTTLCAPPTYELGCVGIGTSADKSNESMLTVKSNLSTGYGVFIDAPNLISSEGNWALYARGSCANSTGTWTQASDINLKREVRPFNDGLTQVLKIDPIRFRFKEDSGLNPNDEHVGVSAQDLEKVAPYMITKGKIKLGTEEEYLHMDNGPMIYMLINATKELNAHIKFLKEEMSAMKAELVELKSNIRQQS